MKITRTLSVFSFFALLALPPAPNAGTAPPDSATVTASGILWQEPADISSRDLLNGPYTQKPAGPFVFVKEDQGGTNPKFLVRDSNEIEWRVKVGVEARPEVAASRILWAAGYFTSEYHFLPTLPVENMPELERGQSLRGPDGSFYGARLKREPKGKKIDTWSWRENPFSGKREFNGLRVMMAIINNWDLKTENNAVYSNPEAPSNEREVYLINDLGASFGSSNWIRPLDHAKGNLVSYTESTFIRRIEDGQVDFAIATRPAIINAVNLPLYLKYLRMGWIGKRIPREDARWVGELLSHLSLQQISDAFRAAGYGPHEVEGFATILLDRIGKLKEL